MQFGVRPRATKLSHMTIDLVIKNCATATYRRNGELHTYAVAASRGKYNFNGTVQSMWQFQSVDTRWLLKFRKECMNNNTRNLPHNVSTFIVRLITYNLGT